METSQIQKMLADSISKAVDIKLSSFQTTNSTVGLVLDEPIGFECTVKVGVNEYLCSIPEHLHSWIQKDDVVIIQDLYNDGRKRMIIGKTGQVQKSPSLVFADPETDKNMSGVDGIFDEKGDKLDTCGTVIIE